MTATTQRFWSKVDCFGADGLRGPDECWPWMAARSAKGYGLFNPGHPRCVRAHRYVWEIVFGPIPIGMLVLHHCDNPPCCNPAHLWLGTAKDNARDMMEKGRRRGYIASGSGHETTKLTREGVLQIRSELAQGAKRGDLARRFGVARATIRGVDLRLTWRMV